MLAVAFSSSTVELYFKLL